MIQSATQGDAALPSFWATPSGYVSAGLKLLHLDFR
jgi:hypothetical protein